MSKEEKEAANEETTEEVCKKQYARSEPLKNEHTVPADELTIKHIQHISHRCGIEVLIA